jgi:hypothetical protein
LLTIIIGLSLILAARERRIEELKEIRTRRANHSLRLSRMLTDNPRAMPTDDLDLTGEDRTYLAQVLRQIFPKGAAGLDDQARCIEIMRYVAARLLLEDTVGTATHCLQEGRAICGGMAVVFVALCRQAGIPARKIGMYNLPGMGCHAVAEACYDDRWHFFDPTFGVFFASQPEYDAGATIADLADLLDMPERWHVFKVVEKPWIGRYDDEVRAHPVTPVEDSYLRDRYGFVLRSQYAQYFRVAFPIEVGPQLLSYPLTADLRDESTATIGLPDNSDLDLWTAGHYQLGPNGFHTWTIKGGRDQRVTIDYTTLAPGAAPLVVVPLKAVRAVHSRADGRNLSVSFQTSDDEALVAIFSNLNVPLEAIRVNKQPAHESNSRELSENLSRRKTSVIR